MPYNQLTGFPAYMPNIGAPTIPSGTNDIQGVRWVSCLDEVKAASVPFGRSLFMQNNEMIFYVKDSNGVIQTFAFNEITPPAPEDLASELAYTKQEISELKAQLEFLRSNNAQQSIQSTTAADWQQFAQSNADAQTAQYDASTSQPGVLQQGCSDGTDGISAQSTT